MFRRSSWEASHEWPPVTQPVVRRQCPDIVATGAPMRNIPPCGSCHGRLDSKLGVPWLDPQPRDYLKTQLEAFAHGTRRNGTSAQMRNIARNMTPEEIDASVDYYSGTR